MSVPLLSAQEPASEPAPVDRRSLQELLPTGTLRLLVGAGMVAAVVASFAHFGLTGHALLGAVFTPVLVLLAAIDARNRLLPNVIIGPGQRRHRGTRRRHERITRVKSTSAAHEVVCQAARSRG